MTATVSEAPTIEPVTASARGAWRRWSVAAAVPVVAAFMLVVSGFGRSSIGSASAWYMLVGEVRCGALSVSDLLAGTCPVVGGVGGSEIGNGMPMTVAGAALVRATGLSAEWAVMTVGYVVMCAAVAGCVMLLRSYQVRPWIGLVAATAYVASPTVLGMREFGATYWGMSLLPAAIWFARSMAGRVAARPDRWTALVLVGWFLGSLVMLMLDGYAFILAQAGAGLLLVIDAVVERRWWSSARAVSALVVVDALAYATYKAVYGGGEWTRSSIDLFRAMGADVVTFLGPSNVIWWAKPLGLDQDYSQLWGDGTNSRQNYVGVLVLVLAVVGAVIAWRRDRRTFGWVVIGLLALVMALGPSLKFDAVRGPLTPPITYESYLMPASDGTFGLPSEWVYSTLPGIDMMRATYRWFALTRLALIVLAAVAVERMVRRGGRWRVVGALLGVLAVVEIAPNVPQMIEKNDATASHVADVDRRVVEPLDAALPDGARVVFAPNAVGGNDYLAGYLATGAHLWTYNVGGDKALEASRKLRPAPVSDLLSKDGDVSDAMVAVLGGGFADFVVVPYFDLRWSVSQWPATAAYVQTGTDAADDAQADPRLDVERFETFAVVSLATGR